MFPAESQPSLVDAIPQLEHNIPAAHFAGGSTWPLVLGIVGIAVLLGGTLIWLYWRRKHTHAPLPPSPLEHCTALLNALEEQLPSMRECSIRLSLIIREFLAGQAQDSSLYETHEEFTQRIDSLHSLPPTCRLETQSLLNALAEFKYTGVQEDNPTLQRDLIGRTRNLFLRIVEEQQKEAALKKQLATTIS